MWYFHYFNLEQLSEKIMLIKYEKRNMIWQPALTFLRYELQNFVPEG